MSRLDSGIRRLETQRDVLNRAAELAGDVPGIVLELGLGNGRTYDHLRERLPGREIFAFELNLSAHPDSIPDADHLVLGDLLKTLPAAAARLGGRAALAHVDVASGWREESLAFTASLAPLLLPLLAKGAIVAAEMPLPGPGLTALPLPATVEPGRYCLYRFG